MNEAFEIKGFWWLPEKLDIQLSGTLIYSPNAGIQLELLGDLHASTEGDFRLPALRDADLILGLTTQGKEASLLNCIHIRANPHIGPKFLGTTETSYRVGRAFIGVHFPSMEAIRFTQFSIRYTDLDEWMHQDLFEIESQDFSEITLRYKKPDPFRTQVGDYVVSFVSSGPSLQRPGRSEITVSQKSWVTIQSSAEEKALGDFITIVRQLQDFLTLGVGRPVYPIEIEAYSDVNVQTLDNGKTYRPPIQIYYALPWKPKETQHLYADEMPFTLKTLSERVGNCLNLWCQKSISLKPVFSLYFATLYKEDIYIEMIFLSLAQAIETYHHRVYGGKYQSDEEFLEGLYKTLVAAIPNDLARNFKTSLINGKLKYANQYSLRKRLLLLSEHLAENMEIEFLSDQKQRENFADRVTRRRNYLTHYSEDLEKGVLDGLEIPELIRKLRFILQICFLEELGFSFEKITGLFRKSYEYSQFLD